MNYRRKSYNITEPDILAGEYDPMGLVEPLWWSVSIYDGLTQYEADLKPFTPSQRAVFAALWLDSEVCNGGFDQFMYNSTGIVWKDALAGFELIGAEKLAAILRRVIEKCGGAIPFDRAERQELLDRITADPENEGEYIDLFGEDDSEYYSANDELEELIMEYVKANPSEFTFAGEVDVPENMM